MKHFALLFLAACGARTQLDDPTTLSAPIAAYGGAKCAVTRPTILVPAPPIPADASGWNTIQTLTAFRGRLYWSLPAFTGAISDDAVPGAIVSMPLGGGEITTVVPTKIVSAWDATFVLDDDHITFVDTTLKQAPLAGGDPIELGDGTMGFLLDVTRGKDGFLVGGSETISLVGASSTITLSNDPLVSSTRKLVDGGDALYGASIAGLYRLDGDRVTMLSTEDSDDFVVDDTYVYYTFDPTPNREIGARVPKAGGAIEHFFSPLPIEPDQLMPDQGLAQDAARVYFGDGEAITAVTKSTGEVRTIAEGRTGYDHPMVTSVAVDDECVYWATIDNVIWAAPKR